MSGVWGMCGWVRVQRRWWWMHGQCPHSPRAAVVAADAADEARARQLVQANQGRRVHIPLRAGHEGKKDGVDPVLREVITERVPGRHACCAGGAAQLALHYAAVWAN